MIAVSQQFRDALRLTHTRRVKVEALDSRNQPLAELPVSDGSVTMDLSQQVGLRTGRVTVGDPSFTPTAADSPLAPFAQHRLRPSVGVYMPATDTVEWCPLGLYLITGVTLSQPFGGLVVQLADLAYLAQQDTLEQPYQPPAGSAAQRIRDLLARVFPAIVVARDDTNGATVTTFDDLPGVGATVWEVCTSIAEQVSCNLWLDDDGNIVLHRPDQPGAAVETVNVGPTGVIVSTDAELSRVGVVNKVTVIHEGQDDTTATGVATITDTNHPLHPNTFGRAGQVVVENVETAQQDVADAAALRLLTDRAGLLRTTTITTAPLPHLRPGDTIDLATTVAGAAEQATVQAVTHTLTASGATTINARWTPNVGIGQPAPPPPFPPQDIR